MYLLTIAFLSLFFRPDVSIHNTMTNITPLNALAVQPLVGDIDSNDQVIIDFDQVTFDGDVVEVPVFIVSDDMIFSLDFSMLLNLDSVEYESIVDHTQVLQYTAFFNPDDLKLRFTSNDFSPYPVYPNKVVSIRFRLLHGIAHLSDFQMLVAYMNGEGGCSSSFQLQGDEIIAANKDIITNETFITPNPAGDYIYISTEEEGTLDMFDFRGSAVIRQHHFNSNVPNRIDVQSFPRGTYTVRLTTEDHTVKTQRIVLQ